MRFWETLKSGLRLSCNGGKHELFVLANMTYSLFCDICSEPVYEIHSYQPIDGLDSLVVSCWHCGAVGSISVDCDEDGAHADWRAHRGEWERIEQGGL